MTKPRRTEIRLIQSRDARNVCFSKRRNGLFKKAEDLKRLYPNIYVTAIVFSPAGKPFVYGNPDSVLHPFLSPPSDLPRHRHADMFSVDISRLNRTDLESYSHHLQLLRSRLISDGVVSFPESGVSSEFLKFSSGSGPELGFGMADKTTGFVNFSDFGVDSEFNFCSGSEISRGNEGLVPELGSDFGTDINNSNIGSVNFSHSGVDSEINFYFGSEISRGNEGFGTELGADFESNMDGTNINSQRFSESGAINSGLVGFSSGPEIVGDDRGLWSGSETDLGFTVSELDAQIMDSDDFLNLTELGFDFEPEKDKVVTFGDGFEPKIEEDEIETVLRGFLDETKDNDNYLNSVF